MMCARVFKNRNASDAEMNYVPLFILNNVYGNIITRFYTNRILSILCVVVIFFFFCVGSLFYLSHFPVYCADNACLIIKVCAFISGNCTKYGRNECGWFTFVRAILYLQRSNILFACIDGCCVAAAVLATLIACQLNLYNRLMNAIDLIRNWICVAAKAKASHCQSILHVHNRNF